MKNQSENLNENSTDPRVLQSKASLTSAFIELLNEKNYDKITIGAIAKRAGVGRKTFYRVFQSKENLLSEIFAELMAKVPSLIRDDGGEDAVIQNTIEGFRFVAQHANVFMAILKSPFVNPLSAAAENYLISDGRRDFGGKEIPNEIVSHFFANGLITLIRWWLQNGMPYPAEQMAAYANEILIRPLQNLPKKS